MEKEEKGIRLFPKQTEKVILAKKYVELIKQKKIITSKKKEKYE